MQPQQTFAGKETCKLKRRIEEKKSVSAERGAAARSRERTKKKETDIGD